MNILRALWEAFWNFISIFMRLDYRDYIGKIFNKSEKIYICTSKCKRCKLLNN